ncbi:MAG TPA: phosphatase PAP2 family protein [Pelobium sp.]|nr:phosphatase PAP2 family protein [Pelobium sp.]
MKKYKTLFRAYINDYKLVPQFSTIIIASVIMVVAIICFYGLTKELAEDKLKVYDDFVIRHIVGFRTPFNTEIMKSVTFIGNLIGYALIIPILTIFFIIRKTWRLSLEITSVLLLSSGLNVVLKNIIERQRPPEIGRLVFAQFYSFPSGHAMSAVTFYGFIIYLCIILVKKAWLKYSIISLCIFISALIGISRIYLGVHYPSDILAGYIGGLAWLMFCILVLNLITLSKIKLKEANILH